MDLFGGMAAQNYGGVIPHQVTRVLVVDHDSTSLAIISSMLSLFGYQVVTAKCAMEALTIARSREDELHFILTEARLPDMGRYELLERMSQTTQLPLIIMSDDKSNTAKLGCLFKGATLYLVKPLTINTIRTLSLISFTKNGKRTLITTAFFQTQPMNMNESKEKKNKPVKRNGKRKCLEDGNGGINSTVVLKKPKLVWTKQLHNRFLHAVGVLGIDKAHPKVILEFMNVPGLTKENISSHLQKFRQSLKKSAANYHLENGSFQFSNSLHPPSFGSQIPNNLGTLMAAAPPPPPPPPAPFGAGNVGNVMFIPPPTPQPQAEGDNGGRFEWQRGGMGVEALNELAAAAAAAEEEEEEEDEHCIAGIEELDAILRDIDRGCPEVLHGNNNVHQVW